jgi:serine/threonine-protein kinase RsbW
MASTLIIPAELKQLAALRRFVEDTAQSLQAGRGAVEDMILAVDEAATNIILHGYQGQPGDIQVEVSLEDGWLQVRLCDWAPLFDPTQVPPPDLTLPLERRRFGGLGVYLARQCMDEVSYCVSPEGCNQLTLRKMAHQPGADSGDQNANRKPPA